MPFRSLGEGGSTIDGSNPKWLTTPMAKQQGILNDTDLDKIGAMIDLRFDLKVKNELEKIIDDRLGNLPTKDEFTKQLSEFLKTSQDKSEEEDVHDLQHKNLGKDTTKLQQQVQHLFKTFEIKDPTEVAISI